MIHSGSEMLALACALLVTAADSKELKKGEELFSAFKWAEARAALAEARAKAKGLSREQLLRILELSGVAASQQRQVDAAQTAFMELLVLAPEHQLEAEYAPRVMTPFYEAKRLAQEKGALTVAVEPTTAGTRVESLTVRVTNDPLGHTRSVRFHVGGADSVVPLQGGAASVAVGSAEVSWSAELLGDNEAEVYRLEPRVDRPPPPVVAAPPPTPAPAPAITAPPPAAPAKRGGLRAVSYVAFALALAAGGTGGYFGWRSGDAFGRLDRALPDGGGLVTSITERDAYALQADGRSSALIANSLYIGAGVLAVAALVLFLVGG